jgi:hypothetical protein
LGVAGRDAAANENGAHELQMQDRRDRMGRKAIEPRTDRQREILSASLTRSRRQAPILAHR